MSRRLLKTLRRAVIGWRQPAPGSTVLSVRLVLSRHPQVLLDLTTSQRPPGEALEENADGKAQQLAWEMPLADVLQRRSGCLGDEPGDFELALPQALKEDLLYRLQSLEGAVPRPLWLNLCRPYGVVGALDWEQQVGDALNRPLLRLPDFPVSPAQRFDILEAALLVDPGEHADEQAIVAKVTLISQALVRYSSRPLTRLNIYAGTRWYPVLAALGDKHIHVHDPAGAPPLQEALRDKQHNSTLPGSAIVWSSWIERTLAGRSLDAVHLLCRSRWDAALGELLLSSSPCPPPGPVRDVTVDLDELNLLFNRAGSWATVFIPATPEDTPAMASLADAFAQRRAGAVLFHSLHNPESYSVACRLLFNGTNTVLAGRPQAPQLRQAFLYCHPDMLHGARTFAAGRSFDALMKVSPPAAPGMPRVRRWYNRLGQHLPKALRPKLTTPPGWVAASQRFIESGALEQVRRASADVLLSKSITPRSSHPPPATDDGVSDPAGQTLDEIATIIQTYLKRDQKEP